MIEKLYRKVNFMDAQEKSLAEACDEIEGKSDETDTKFSKSFQIKQYSDIVESLTAAIFQHSGLHGAQTFLKFAKVLDRERDYDYKAQYMQLIDEVDAFDPHEKLKHSAKSSLEKILGYKFKHINVSF